MPKTITIGANNAPDPDVVVLFEHKYTVRRVTRSVQQALEQADKHAVTARDKGDSDKLVSAMSEGLDALLAAEGHETPAAKVLVEAWKDDRLSLADLAQLDNDLQESAASRPT